MNLLFVFAVGYLGDECQDNSQCDFNKWLICQTVDPIISATYHTCVRHCATDFECAADYFCSCGVSTDSASDPSRAECAMNHTYETAIAYCKDNSQIANTSAKCFTYKTLGADQISKVCGKAGVTGTAGASCSTYENYAIHIKGCKCAAGHDAFFTCKSCLNGKCANCINNYELGEDGDCHAKCRDGINFVACACGKLKTPSTPGLYCNENASSVCGMLGCRNCSDNVSECKQCEEGFVFEGGVCSKKCTADKNTNCLCGSGAAAVECSKDKPVCDVIQGKCALQCNETIAANCYYCNTTIDTCDVCLNGFACVKDGALSAANCLTPCQTKCTPGKIDGCVCESDDPNSTAPSEACGGEGFSCYDTKCLLCPLNCVSCKLNSNYKLVCKKCIEGFGYESSSNETCIPLCVDETSTECSCNGTKKCYIANAETMCLNGECKEKKSCSQSVYNCERCWEDSKVCMECKKDAFCIKDSYYVSTGCPTCSAKCSIANCMCLANSECNAGLTCHENKCTVCLSNCKLCDDTLTCNECADGYGFDDVYTKSKCIAKCNASTMEGCSCGVEGYCSSQHLCIEDKCILKKNCSDSLNASCSKCWMDSNICMQCLNNFYCSYEGSLAQVQCTECLPKCVPSSSANCVCTNSLQCAAHYACEGGHCHNCFENCTACNSTDTCQTCDPGFGCEANDRPCNVCQSICTQDSVECLCGDARIKCVGEQHCIGGKCTDLCGSADAATDCYCPDGLTQSGASCVKRANPMTIIIIVVAVVVAVFLVIVLLLVLKMLKKRKSKANVRQAGFNIKSSTDSSEEERKRVEEKRKKKAAAQTKYPIRDRVM